MGGLGELPNLALCDSLAAVVVRAFARATTVACVSHNGSFEIVANSGCRLIFKGFLSLFVSATVVHRIV